MNEVFKLHSAKKYQTAKRIVKRRVKNAVIAQEKSQGNIPYDEQTKDMHRKLFNIMNSRENKKTITEKSLEYLEEILNKTSLRSAPNNLKNFIKEFHISFIKFNNNQDNERYFQKLFPNYNPHDLNQLLDFYEELKTIYRGITKLTNEVKTYIQKLPRGNDYSFLNDMITEINSMNEKKFWGNPVFNEAFKSFNPKLLKKIGKKEIEDFRISHNFMTKSLFKKQQKEWMKNNL